LTSGLFAVAAGTELKKGPRGLPTVEEAAARYPDPRHRFLSIGADALNETEAISLVLGERDYHLATRLLVSFGSLTALSRASLAQLSPLLGKARAMRLMAAFRLGPLSSLGQLAGAPIDSPERVYELFAQELRLADREILAVALLDTSASLLCALPDLMAPVTRETSCGTSRLENKAAIRQRKNFALRIFGAQIPQPRRPVIASSHNPAVHCPYAS
jgi:hypothetical protein